MKILRCSKAEDAYQDTVYWLNKLTACESDGEKRQIAKEAIGVQQKASGLDIRVDAECT